MVQGERVARAALHLFPSPLILASFSSILSLFRPPSPFSFHSLIFICFICNVSKTVDSVRAVYYDMWVANGEERRTKKGRGRKAKRRREIKMHANPIDTSCWAQHFAACAGLRSCVQQDSTRISFLSSLPFLALFPPPPTFSFVSSRTFLFDALSSFSSD